MKNYFGAVLKRLFGGEKKPEIQTSDVNSVVESHAELEPQAAERDAEQAAALTIWTIERSRFSAARAFCTDVEVYPSGAVALHEDIKGYVFDTPSGESVVVEARTGSLVGHSLEVVRDGVREMTKVQLNSQLDTARREFNRMKKHELSNDDFWKAIKMGGAEIDVAQDYQE